MNRDNLNIRETIKKFNHKYSCFSWFDVFINNDEELELFFSHNRGCTKLYIGQQRQFTEYELKVLFQYGTYKLFFNGKFKPHEKNGIEKEYLEIINKMEMI